jgi:hypothetical protein
LFVCELIVGPAGLGYFRRGTFWSIVVLRTRPPFDQVWGAGFFVANPAAVCSVLLMAVISLPTTIQDFCRRLAGRARLCPIITPRWTAAFLENNEMNINVIETASGLTVQIDPQTAARIKVCGQAFEEDLPTWFEKAIKASISCDEDEIESAKRGFSCTKTAANLATA